MKLYVTLFSGTVRRRKLKLGTNMNSGWMYHVYWHQAAAAYSSFISFLSHQFSNIKNFHHTFLIVWPTRLKLGTHMDNIRFSHGVEVFNIGYGPRRSRGH